MNAASSTAQSTPNKEWWKQSLQKIRNFFTSNNTKPQSNSNNNKLLL